MSLRAAVLLIAAAVLPATPALCASPQSLGTQSGKPFLHASSGLAIPDNVDGFERGRASDYGTSQSDVSFMFHDDSTKSTSTVYIYRAGIPNVSIWTERADAAIHLSAAEHYGTLDEAGRQWARFSPWSNSPDSALRIVYPVSGKTTSATGLIIAQHGAWLIKIRITSSVLTAAQLDKRLGSFFAELNLPAPKDASALAYAIQACADALPGKKAKLVQSGNGDEIMAGALANSIVLEVADTQPTSTGARPVIYCRDAASQAAYSVFRSGGSREAYLIAAGDGGATLMIGPDAGARMLNPKSGAYSVTLLTTDRQFGFVPYQSMPAPRQTMDELGSARPTYIRSRIPGQQKEIQIVM
ncbi:MAG: hypothetical protein ABL914_00205 [Novosphingobium sp.]|uniref:hypothetical protein n=1 Tax=Novosphingobium sp. TaxID=1874826 RepID=UPI0032BC6701